MAKAEAYAVIVSLILNAYLVNIFYRSDQALKAAIELGTTRESVRLLQSEQERVHNNLLNSTVRVSDDPKDLPELYYQGDKIFQVVRFGEKTIQDDLGQKLLDVQGKLGDALDKEEKLKRELEEYKTKRFTVF